MKAEQAIRREILRSAQRNNPEYFDFGPLDTGDRVDAAYDELAEPDDFEAEFRGGQVETNLPTKGSRHYESKSVAMRTEEGEWVGWTYWYGGGKHGYPESVDWMEDAYYLKCHEEEKLVVVRTFEAVKSED